MGNPKGEKGPKVSSPRSTVIIYEDTGHPRKTNTEESRPKETHKKVAKVYPGGENIPSSPESKKKQLEKAGDSDKKQGEGVDCSRV